MSRIPQKLDLSEINGQFATQIRVGQYDLQFSFGDVDFVIQSWILIERDGEIVGSWQESKWPSPEFYNLMNSEVRSNEILEERIIINLKNDYSIIILLNNPENESVQIYFKNQKLTCVI